MENTTASVAPVAPLCALAGPTYLDRLRRAESPAELLEIVAEAARVAFARDLDALTGGTQRDWDRAAEAEDMLAKVMEEAAKMLGD